MWMLLSSMQGSMIAITKFSFCVQVSYYKIFTNLQNVTYNRSQINYSGHKSAGFHDSLFFYTHKLWLLSVNSSGYRALGILGYIAIQILWDN